ncbi:MAG: hypothetical protein B7Z02_09665 [Rhodobacterales bacterium 32-67-9]|nr:MAG: hypothetical protein B7Z02_09665 [Rhodobacterales bacterium 32-67-9]
MREDASPGVGPQLLAVEVPPALLEPVRKAMGGSCIVARYETLNLHFLAQVMPDTILAPLLGPGFDILDLVDRLGRIGFGGALRALTPPLPAPDAVIAEVRSHAAGLDFDLIVVPDDGPVSG